MKCVCLYVYKCVHLYVYKCVRLHVPKCVRLHYCFFFFMSHYFLFLPRNLPKMTYIEVLKSLQNDISGIFGQLILIPKSLLQMFYKKIRTSSWIIFMSSTFSWAIFINTTQNIYSHKIRLFIKYSLFWQFWIRKYVRLFMKYCSFGFEIWKRCFWFD